MRPDLFESQRRRLQALAYRILGSVSEAEDAVQETYLKWGAADQSSIRTPAAWLTTCCTRQCLDVLKQAQRTRTEYVGTWLPEPLHMATDDTPEQIVALASSVSTAFLLVLERLTPKERAAYLLHEILDLAYPDVAEALSIGEPACRQLVSRARAKVGGTARHPTPPRVRQEQLLAEFQHAVATGSTGGLSKMLSEDIELSADGGGKVPTIDRVLHGVRSVTGFVKQLHTYWKDYGWRTEALSGGLGIVLQEGQRVAAAVTFAYDRAGLVTNIYVVRNPQKLAHLPVAGEDPS